MLFLHCFLTCFLMCFWTDFGVIFGPFGHNFPMFVRLCFRMVFRGVLLVALGAHGVQKGSPKGVQNRSKISSKSSLAPKPHLDAFWTRFGVDFGTILGQFWDAFGGQNGTVTESSGYQCKSTFPKTSNNWGLKIT